MSVPRLPAATPDAWFATHLDAFLRAHATGPVDESARRWFDLPDLLLDDAAPLREMFTRYCLEGATPQAAAKWVVGGFAGRPVAALGVLYALGGAAVLPGAQPRVGLHPDGWVELVDLRSPRLAVNTGHPWAGLPGVVTVPPGDLPGLVVASVQQVAEPLVRAGRRLARVGSATLWAELGDSFACWAGYHAELPVDDAVLADLERVLRAPGVPWRKRPDLWMVDHRGRPTALARKAGCCLAYQCAPVSSGSADAAGGTTDDPVPDSWEVAWRAAFPPVEGDPEYCTTCSLRAQDDCAARLLWERDYDLQERAATAAG